MKFLRLKIPSNSKLMWEMLYFCDASDLVALHVVFSESKLHLLGAHPLWVQTSIYL